MERPGTPAEAGAAETPGGPEAPERRAGVWPFVVAGLATIVLVAATLPAALAGDERAPEAFLDGQQLRIMAPADPGGGWDQTAREMQAALRDLVGRSEVYNVGGAGGTIGLSQFDRLAGDPTELMVMGLIMVGAIESNDSPVSLEQTTPLVRLTTDYEVIVVPADSPLNTTADLVAEMEEDLGAVSIAGGSAGGVEQVLAGLMAEAIGADPAGVNYIAHSGGGEALSTVLSGRATAAVSGVSEILPQIEAGNLRPLAVSSPERLPALPDVPTLIEDGVDVELANWRAVVAPAGISEEEEQALEDLILEMAGSDAWQEALERRGWGDATLAGPEFEEFVEAEQSRIAQVLGEIGLG
jgi:putative tricarboxylic transport membrane protein